MIPLLMKWVKPMLEINKEYATALFSLAKESDNEQQFAVALSEISELFRENPEYIDLLASPSIPIDERIHVIDTAFSSRAPEYIVSFLKVLCEQGHIREIFKSIENFEALYRASLNITVAKVTSAVALSEEQKKALEKKLNKICSSRIVAEYRVDANLVGGLLVDLDGKVIDGSLKHRLQQVKEVID